MVLTKKGTVALTLAILVSGSALLAGQGTEPARPTNVAAASTGAKVVLFGSQHKDYPALRIIDSKPDAWWSDYKSGLPQSFVVELPAEFLISRVSFDNGAVEGDQPGSSVKEVKVAVSTEAEDIGFKEVGVFTLAKGEVGQGFRLDSPARARWIKLTVVSNYGHGAWTIMGEFRAMGVSAPKQTRETADGFIVSLPDEVLFDVAKSTLRPDGQKALAETLPILFEYPSSTVVVEGHTDSTGTIDGNKALSLARAISVGDWLNTSRGNSRWRIETRGAGSAKPIESNATPAGRQRNRRVEITILKTTRDL